jgi:hypothetical protein
LLFDGFDLALRGIVLSPFLFVNMSTKKEKYNAITLCVKEL